MSLRRPVKAFSLRPAFDKVMPGRRAASAAGTLLLAFTVWLFSASAAHPAGKELRLKDAYALAVANHEAVMIAAETVEQASQNLSMNRSRILPRVTAEGAYTRFSEQKFAGSFLIQPDEVKTADLLLTQPLYTGGSWWSSQKQARMFVSRTREGLDAAREDVVLATARAYYTALKAGKDVEIKEAALKRARERKKVAEARFRVGEVVKSAVLRAEAELAGAEAELIKARSAVRDAGNVLKRIVGVDYEIALVEPGPSPVISETVEPLIKMAYEKRLDIRQSDLDREIASESVREAWGSFLPSLRLEGRYSWRDQEPQTTFFQKESVSGTLVLSYPLFEGGLRRAEIKDARSRLREAELRLLGLKRDIELQVREAYNDMESVKAVKESYAKQLSFAEEDYKMVFEQFKFGLATTVDVIDSDTELISAQRSFMNASFDLKLAVLEVRYAVGVLLEETLQ